MGESGDIFVSGALLGGGGKEVRSRGGIIKREVGVNYWREYVLRTYMWRWGRAWGFNI